MSVIDLNILKELYPNGQEFTAPQAVKRIWPDMAPWEKNTRISTIHFTMNKAIKYGLAKKRVEGYRGHQTTWFSIKD